MAVVVKDRTCRQCGAIFRGGPRAWYCPSCRQERRLESSRRFRANGPARPLGSTDFCVVCGNPYIVNSARQKYCPDCAPDAIRAVDNAQSIAWNAENVTPEYRLAHRAKTVQPRACVICGKVFLPRDSSITCSKDCSKELDRRKSASYGRDHRSEINARKSAKRREKMSLMSPEELAAYRAKVNAKARENYRKRKSK